MYTISRDAVMKEIDEMIEEDLVMLETATLYKLKSRIESIPQETTDEEFVAQSIEKLRECE